jgi:hypothetical protein
MLSTIKKIKACLTIEGKRSMPVSTQYYYCTSLFSKKVDGTMLVLTLVSMFSKHLLLKLLAISLFHLSGLHGGYQFIDR